MLQPTQSFYVYSPDTGQIRYTVDHPAPTEILKTWTDGGEVFVIAGTRKDLWACYIALERAAVFSEIIMPLYYQREEKQAALLQLIAEAETLRGKVLPYNGYEKEKIPEDVLAAASALDELQARLSDLTAETADLSAAIDTHTYENGSPVIDRPKLDLPTEYDVQHGGDEVSFALPAGTVWAFRVEGQDAGTHTDEFSMSAAEIGEYLVQAVCWPYEDFQAIIRAH